MNIYLISIIIFLAIFIVFTCSTAQTEESPSMGLAGSGASAGKIRAGSGIADSGKIHAGSGASAESCPIHRVPRSEHHKMPFASSNGMLQWLTTHPAYFREFYHGYFPWATEDYSRSLPFE